MTHSNKLRGESLADRPDASVEARRRGQATHWEFQRVAFTNTDTGGLSRYFAPPVSRQPSTSPRPQAFLNRASAIPSSFGTPIPFRRAYPRL